MHPELMNQLASRHGDELRLQPRPGRPHVGRPGPGNTMRHRAGWTLVEIGLRLAGTSHDG